MADTKSKKIAITNTKQEMMDAYNQLLLQLEEKREQEIKPAEKIKEKETKDAVLISDSLNTELVSKKIAELKFEYGKTLADIAEELENEINKYNTVKKAVSAKEAELKEMYEIEKAAMSLTALLTAQSVKKDEFESEIEEKRLAGELKIKSLRDDFDTEMKSKREEWEAERKKYQSEIKERDSLDLKLRTREKEDFQYNFEKEKQSALDKLNSEKNAIERSIAEMKEKAEKEMSEREKSIASREQELIDLRAKSADFQKELDNGIAKAVKDATEKIIIEAKHKEELLLKEIEGERKLFDAKNTSLEKTIKEQSEQISKLALQVDKSYHQVQDIAIKAVESSSRNQSMASSLQNNEL